MCLLLPSISNAYAGIPMGGDFQLGVVGSWLYRFWAYLYRRRLWGARSSPLTHASTTSKSLLPPLVPDNRLLREAKLSASITERYSEGNKEVFPCWNSRASFVFISLCETSTKLAMLTVWRAGVDWNHISRSKRNSIYKFPDITVFTLQLYFARILSEFFMENHETVAMHHSYSSEMWLISWWKKFCECWFPGLILQTGIIINMEKCILFYFSIDFYPIQHSYSIGNLFFISLRASLASGKCSHVSMHCARRLKLVAINQLLPGLQLPRYLSVTYLVI